MTTTTTNTVAAIAAVLAAHRLVPAAWEVLSVVLSTCANGISMRH
jgi:hypothetical protein